MASYEELKRLRDAASKDLSSYHRMHAPALSDMNFIAYSANHAIELLEAERAHADRLAAALKKAFKIARPWATQSMSWPEWDAVCREIEEALAEHKKRRSDGV